MYGIRELSSAEMDLVSGGYLVSDPQGGAGATGGGGYNGSGSYLLNGSGSSTSIGSVGGWTFGVANGDHGLGVWATSPSGAHYFEAYKESGGYKFDGGNFEIDMTFQPNAQGEQNTVEIEWKVNF